MYLTSPKKVKVLENRIFPCQLCKRKLLGVGDTLYRFTVNKVDLPFTASLEYMYVCSKCAKKIEKQEGIIND